MAAPAETELRTGAHALVEALELHGVELVFGIPGQHALALWDALSTSPIRTVVVRHEQAAAFAAAGYARTTGRVAVCLTSTGPGAFNAFAGMGEADASSLRLLHVTTQVPSDPGQRGWMHETAGQTEAFRAVARSHSAPRTPAALAAAVDEALCAIACRPGPAMIEALTQVLTAPAGEAQIARRTPIAPPAADAAAIERVRELLAGSRAPLLFAGGGCREAAARVVALAEALDAPVVTSFNGKGTLPAGHPLHAGSSQEEPAIRRLIGESDVCIALGTRFAEEYTGHWASPFPAALVQVDLDAARIGRNYPVAEGIVADAGSFCDALLALHPPAGSRDGAAAARAAMAGRQAELAAHGYAEERALLHQIDAALPPDALLVGDMTIQAYWAVLYLDARAPGGFAYPMSGALGSAIPTALGVCAGNPGRPVIVLAGDGGFLMAGHELLTARQNGLHMVVLLVNDGRFGVLENYQRQTFGRTTAVDMTPADFAALARAHGAGYARIDRVAEVGAALRAAIAELGERSTVIELATSLAAPPQSV